MHIVTQMAGITGQQLDWQTVTVSDSGKHLMAEPSAELSSKILEMVPNGLNIPMYES